MLNTNKNIKMQKKFIGIDPGSTGAIVIIGEDRKVIEMMPITKNGKEFDLQEACRFLKEISTQNVHAVLEDVHAIQGTAGNSSNFNFGRSKMMWEMGLMAYGIPHTLVQPKAWQKHAWEGVTKTMVATKRKLQDGSFMKKVDTKMTSLTAVQRLYPMVDLRDPDRKTERAKKPHEGIVDALLMADYCRNKFK
jgi:hypothetical protein